MADASKYLMAKSTEEEHAIAKDVSNRAFFCLDRLPMEMLTVVVRDASRTNETAEPCSINRSIYHG